ncbi:flagellar basal-body protein flbY [alpha proteobacterium U9-1i]|nr:flagellar basal-body protein flbY [alpha proteobacterium U9-1i]
MALIADGAADRADQLLLLTERLGALVAEETRRIEAREPPLAGAEADEKNRLANAYRLELARLKQEPGMLADAPEAALAQLRSRTVQLQTALSQHEISLNAVKLIAEGLVEAMAQELVRQRGGGGVYGAGGAIDAPSSPISAVLDRSA